MAEDLRVRIEIGALAPLQTVGSAIADLVVVCDVGSELQRRSSRAGFIRRMLRDLGPPYLVDELKWFDYPGSRWPAAALAAGRADLPLPEVFSQALANYILEYGTDDEVLIRELRYANPIDAHLVVVGGGIVLALLKMLRDWSSERRERGALADDVADETRMRTELRKRLLQRIADGEMPIPEEWIESLLTERSAGAFDRLSRRDVQLPSDADDDDHAT